MKTTNDPNDPQDPSSAASFEALDASPSRLSDEDLALLFAYLDDELEELARLRFEVRLSEDEDLADEYELLAPTDALQRSLSPAARKVSSGPWRGGPSWTSWLRSWWPAAAVVLVVGLTLASTIKRGRSPAVLLELSAAALPFERQLMDEAVRELGAELALSSLRNERPSSGAEPAQGAGGQSPLKPTELIAALAAAEEARALAALEQPEVEVCGAYYALAAEVSCAAEAVVIELLAGERPRLAHADGSKTIVFDLEPGSPRWIPAAPLDLAESFGDVPEDAWRRPFLVPRDAGTLRAILAVHVESIDTALVDELTAFLATAESVDDPGSEGSDQALRAWLSKRGFETRAFLVREPK